MLKAIFTLDYEIHGNGDGCPYKLMVEPTERMMRQFEKYGAKLTILADIGEILQFKRYAEETGRDDYHYGAISAQLKDAIRRGHDVQLHIHSSYFNARHENGRWIQDWSEYSFADLPLARAKEMIRVGKQFLEDLLQPVEASYRCFVFRAANWSMNPSRNATQALVENGLRIDTSVFKYGRRDGRVSFDYSHAPSSLIPWRANSDDICKLDSKGELYEFPIYSESRWIGAFFTPQRIYRTLVSRLHRVSDYPAIENEKLQLAPQKRRKSLPSFLTQKSAWKADFNQCSGSQLIRALQRAKKHMKSDEVLPFVLIGHSKLFTSYNEWDLTSFFEFIARHSQHFGFASFRDFDLAKF